MDRRLGKGAQVSADERGEQGNSMRGWQPIRRDGSTVVYSNFISISTCFRRVRIVIIFWKFVLYPIHQRLDCFTTPVHGQLAFQRVGDRLNWPQSRTAPNRTDPNRPFRPSPDRAVVNAAHLGTLHRSHPPRACMFVRADINNYFREKNAKQTRLMIGDVFCSRFLINHVLRCVDVTRVRDDMCVTIRAWSKNARDDRRTDALMDGRTNS